MQLAKALHWRGFYITFVNTESNHRRLARSLGPTFVMAQLGFQFETIPDGLASWDADGNPDVSALCDSTRKSFLEPFKELLIKLNNASLGVPPVSAIISDGVMNFAIQAAKELNIAEAQFWTASACGFMGYLQFGELANRGIIPFKDNESITDSALDMPVDWIPGMKNIRLKDMPSFIRTTNLDETMFDFMGSQVHNCLTSSAIIFNTFHEFELEVLDAIKAKFPNIYNIGPVPMLGRHVPKDKAFIHWVKFMG